MPRSDERGNQRFFSIVSQLGGKEFSIASRLSDSAFKQTLAGMPIGSTLQLDMIAGSFVLPDTALRPLVFIAGGIGITPFISMLRHINDQQLQQMVTVLYSNRNHEAAAFLSELQALEMSAPHVNLVATMTDDPTWSGQSGLIDSDFIKIHAPEWKSSLYYVAGPPGMVDAMLIQLESLGIAKQLVRSEQFSGYR